MKRIRPDEVVHAYKQTGLRPVRHGYFPAIGCACGLGAMFYTTHNKIDNTRTVNEFFDELYGSTYRCAFASGFDNDEYNTHYAGYEDGCAAWQAVVDAGLVGNTL